VNLSSCLPSKSKSWNQDQGFPSNGNTFSLHTSNHMSKTMLQGSMDSKYPNFMLLPRRCWLSLFLLWMQCRSRKSTSPDNMDVRWIKSIRSMACSCRRLRHRCLHCQFLR
jgi:hypothetical protein